MSEGRQPSQMMLSDLEDGVEIPENIASRHCYGFKFSNIGEEDHVIMIEAEIGGTIVEDMMTIKAGEILGTFNDLDTPIYTLDPGSTIEITDEGGESPSDDISGLIAYIDK